MTRRYFGTDGIRGKVGEPPITPEFMQKLGWAVGRVFAKSRGRSQVLIGKDTRLSGYIFESALESGLAAAGVDVALLGPMPTPAVAHLTRTYRAVAGIVISASHNPYYDNGVKFFSGDGAKLPDEVEAAIEAELEKPLALVRADALGKATRIEDARGRYIEFCKSTVQFNQSFSGLKVVLDCAEGATYQVAPAVFTELGANVVSVGVKPDGMNINRERGSTHPAFLQEQVRQADADIGIAFDGDGDRVIMVDKSGDIVDGDALLYIIAMERKREALLRGGVVGTLMTNYGAELAFQRAGIPFSRAAVGDRYVMERLLERGWQLGGESSGHLVLLDKTTTGDGIVSALQVVSAMIRTGRSLAELKEGIELLPQQMVNVRFSRPQSIEGVAEIQDAVAAAESRFNGEGRVLLRASGTEPVVRVMAEGRNETLVREVVESLADVVRTALQ